MAKQFEDRPTIGLREAAVLAPERSSAQASPSSHDVFANDRLVVREPAVASALPIGWPRGIHIDLAS